MHKIVITGGPHSGKTSVIKALVEEFGDRIMVVPEAATGALEYHFPKPGKDIKLTDEWLRYFQAAILPLQEQMENTWTLAAEANGAEALIMDRGMMDGAAYMPGGKGEFIRAFNLDQVEIYKRYDIAICLESVARTHPGMFGKSNNANRYEDDPGVAVQIDASTSEAWREHPNFLFVPCESDTTIGDKIQQVIEIVGELIDWEEEKKFLLHGLPLIELAGGISIEQGYVFTENPSFRVRKMGSRHFQAIKGPGLQRRREWERPIPKFAFDGLWVRTEGARVFKTRYLIPHGRFTLALDRYHHKLEGLYTLECEFTQPEQMDEFVLPEWAKDAVDVTEDPSYKNSCLAKYGLPE